MITATQLGTIMPSTTRAAVFAAPLTRAAEEFHIDAPTNLAAFIAQIGHETGNLSAFEENLNYSTDRLMAVWPKRFPTATSAAPYARNPPALANKVYAGRMGNGDEKSGDGWRYRGSGLLQLTGRDNHAACAKHFAIDMVDIGDWLRAPEGASRSAAWFWTAHGLHKIDDFDKICDVVNIGHQTDRVGDSIGFADRQAIYGRALEVLS